MRKADTIKNYILQNPSIRVPHIQKTSLYSQPLPIYVPFKSLFYTQCEVIKSTVMRSFAAAHLIPSCFIHSTTGNSFSTQRCSGFHVLEIWWSIQEIYETKKGNHMDVLTGSSSTRVRIQQQCSGW